MKKFSIHFVLVLAVSILGVITMHAQQEPLYTQYFFNPLTVNSGYAGSRDAISVNALVREQWIGIEGRPRTQTFSIHAPIGNESLAIGATAIKDKVGPTSSTTVAADLAYRFHITELTRIALGIKGGVDLFSADFNSLENTNPFDQSFNKAVSNSLIPNLGASFYLWSPKYFIGLSAPKILESKLADQPLADFQGKQRRHFYAMAGYVFNLNPNLRFKPTTMIRHVMGSPLSVEITGNILINDVLWVGAAYRIGDSTGLLASYQIGKKLRLGYAFDYTLSPLQKFTNFNTHEIMLGLDFFGKIDKMISPRFF